MQPSRRRPTVVQEVQDYITRYAMERRLKPGDPLPSENELARLVGAGRSSVREAVRSLETMGVLRAQPGTGLFLREFSFEPLVSSLPYGLMRDGRELAELLEIRRVLEIGMIERVIAARDVAHLEAVAEALGAMRGCAERGVSFLEEDRAFHRVLFGVLDNQMFLRLLDVFWMTFHRASERIRLVSENPMETYLAHERILDAVRAGDVEAARTATDSHYDGLASQLTTWVHHAGTTTSAAELDSGTEERIST